MKRTLHRTLVVSALLLPALQSWAERDCARTLSLDGDGAPLVPLDQMSEAYTGQGGHVYAPGLWADGANAPTAEQAATISSAAQEAALPRHADGSPCAGAPEDAGNEDCLIGFVGVTMSNGTQEWGGGGPNAIDPALAFVDKASNHPERAPSLRIVDLGLGGLQAQCLSGDDVSACAPRPDGTSKHDYYWNQLVPARLGQSGVSPQQVTVVWLKLANHDEENPDHVAYLEQNAINALRLLRERMPNIKLVYLNSRIYGGYATEGNNEPIAYEQAFAMRELIVRQANGDAALCLAGQPGCVDPKTPVLTWGKYMWANGTTPNSDGTAWECDDLRSDDGQHPSDLGVDKVSELLVDFFASDPTARIWFAGDDPPVSGDDDAGNDDTGDDDPGDDDSCRGTCDEEAAPAAHSGCSTSGARPGLPIERLGLLAMSAFVVALRRRRSRTRRHSAAP